MYIHEYQAKDLLKAYGVAVPKGHVAFTDTLAGIAAEELGGDRWVVKAQIHSGGRGKSGGVRIVNSVSEAKKVADELIGNRLVTHQNGPDGTLVKRVWIEEAREIEKELYFGLLIDRATQRITLIASSEGGMDIEEIAQEYPEKIIKELVDPAIGLRDFQCRKIAYAIGLNGKLMPQAVKFMKQVYRCFRDKDALQVEINPLAVLSNGKLMALDAKVEFDDYAFFRQPEIAEMRDLDEEDTKEAEASSHGLNYIALEGNIGFLVNGAGLAMATMDAITLHGGRPANFLDVGGGASPNKVASACKIVIKDPNVKSILINIFAGINHCDWIAKGLVSAINEFNIKHPIVVRLAGTHVEEGFQILRDSGLEFILAKNLDDAARKVVETVEEKHR